jgi:hypothetical protein
MKGSEESRCFFRSKSFVINWTVNSFEKKKSQLSTMKGEQERITKFTLYIDSMPSSFFCALVDLMKRNDQFKQSSFLFFNELCYSYPLKIPQLLNIKISLPFTQLYSVCSKNSFNKSTKSRLKRSLCLNIINLNVYDQINRTW